MEMEEAAFFPGEPAQNGWESTAKPLRACLAGWWQSPL